MNRPMNPSIERRAAFTLLEVMLVLVIIGLLAGLVAPKLFGMRDRAKIDTARGNVNNLLTACDLFAWAMDDYPSSLQQLVEKGDLGTKWAGPYMDQLPKDPWDHDFIYEYQPGGVRPRIYSAGPDGQPNTQDDIFEQETK